eukprot:1159398-Pelagomonas_calceolata.AAC.22
MIDGALHPPSSLLACEVLCRMKEAYTLLSAMQAGLRNTTENTRSKRRESFDVRKDQKFLQDSGASLMLKVAVPAVKAGVGRTKKGHACRRAQEKEWTPCQFPVWGPLKRLNQILDHVRNHCHPWTCPKQMTWC